MARNAAEKFLPLPDLQFQILLAIAPAPTHGYAVGLEVEERTEGRITPTAGGLYQAIRRLEKSGLIKRVRAPASESDARRIYLGVTPLGRRVADLEARRLAHLVDLARGRAVLTDRS